MNTKAVAKNFEERVKENISYNYEKLLKHFRDNFETISADEKFVDKGVKVYRYISNDDLIEIRVDRDALAILTKDKADKDTYDNMKCTFKQPIKKYGFNKNGLFMRIYSSASYDEKIHFDIKYDYETDMFNLRDLQENQYTILDSIGRDNRFAEKSPFTFKDKELYEDYFGYFAGKASNMASEWKINLQYQINNAPKMCYCRTFGSIYNGRLVKEKEGVIRECKNDFNRINKEIEEALVKCKVHNLFKNSPILEIVQTLDMKILQQLKNI